MESPRPSKRRRVSSHDLITPPALDLTDSTATGEVSGLDAQLDRLLDHATHVLATEAAALASITRLYRTSDPARQSLRDAVHAIITAQELGGRVIACGVGKSAYIAQKLTATCKSLGISASFLHACEAMHGDLGDIRGEKDVLLFVSYSGKTPELLSLLTHVPEGTRIIALTSHTRPQDCRLLEGSDEGILLPAPVPEREEVSFGVQAPTTSTTCALAVSDMLALTVAEQMHGKRKGEVFVRNHPGGAIGVTEREVKKRKRRGVDVSALELPSPEVSASDDG
ncbi:hypothetical protein LTR56_021189 [Elasticomyces elasticus]|nr:hypothetical protein LTR56_021189 [Elasticomyces elasticus]KAK3631794.1 hypothetical protein LTR22_020932 [Elasticomyces elasticus]KAK4909607.1 hypothetical protein LTR49_021651 [Elasticomyces elasticus]KAK4954342.1 hypothetical protein LTR10_007773 [Elasticomyces elasticus]KAK4970773.1 hypothetical protein LTR42_007750 [Elasticomyces elasticus]